MFIRELFYNLQVCLKIRNVELTIYRVVQKFWPGTKWPRMVLKIFYSIYFTSSANNPTNWEGFGTFLVAATLCQE